MHKILLVDDMRHFLDLTQSFLSRAECSLLTANTGLEAIKVARSESPDLIVLDIEMPEMNGIEACRIIKADPTMRRIPVVMLTSLSKEAEARKAGADHFLKKPIDEETFLREIKKFLPILERQEPRIASDLAAEAELDGRAQAVRVLDLSKSGAFLANLPSLPAIADQFAVTIHLPMEDGSTKQINARAVVVRQVPGRGVGVRFLELSSGARIFVNEYLTRITLKG
jgi:CheY-like chemotaxis protein